MFEIQEPPINIGPDISVRSFELIEEEAKEYALINNFSDDEKEVIYRLIHTTTAFKEIIENIWFSNDAINSTKKILANGGKIIVDTNMIRSGLSDFYLEKYGNEVVCYVNEPEVFELAKEKNCTRSYAAVELAIKKHKNSPMILGCGNAPTFIYAAVNTLISEKIDPKNVSLLNFPVGFVNVVESKEYVKKYIDYFDSNGVILKGRYGASTMIVATLHAIYRLIKDYDGKQKYNGK